MTDPIQTLRGRGYRITQSRRAILAALTESDTWLRPEEIHSSAREAHSHLGLVTVYRTLELLREEGIARRIHLPGGCSGYALKSPGHNHLLVCTRCQRTLEFPGCDLSDLLGALSRKTGYDIRGHILEITGVCPACRTSSMRGEV
jgi:Fe2+ or Zn2+ uptake regulation protein